MAKLNLTDLVVTQSETSKVTAINANSAAIEAALENTLSRDGTTPNEMESDLDMNSNRILNLAEAVDDTEPVRKAEFDEVQAFVTDLTNAIADAAASAAAAAASALAAQNASSSYQGFQTIAVSGQSNVVADTAADTLTLAAGPNITITTNASTDTVTISASGSLSATLADGDYGDITVSGTGTIMNLDAGVVGTTELADGAVTAAKLDSGTFSAFIQTLLDDPDAPTARNTLGLGTAAVQDSSFFAIASHTHAISDITGLQAALDSLSGSSGGMSVPSGRLTLESSVPVSTTDQSNKSTIYYTPYNGEKIPIYSGTAMVNTTFTELSQSTTDTTKSPAACANNSNYDMFVWNDSGTVRCTRGPAWSTDTARGTGAGSTELVRINGLWTNKNAITNGPAAFRGTYVGTIRTNGTATVDNTINARHVWNAYNRTTHSFVLEIPTDSWTYSSATWRQVQGSSTYQVSFVCGLDEELVTASYYAVYNTSTSTSRAATVGIGLDSLTQPHILYMSGNAAASQWSGFPVGTYYGFPGIGYHYLAMLEKGAGSDTQTWYGDAGIPLNLQLGLSGTIMS